MANDSITFLCPACSIKLTVPGSLAGVIGPCPSCRNQIQAPYPPPVQQAPAGQVYPAAPAPVHQDPAVQSSPAVAPPVQQAAAAQVYPAAPAPVHQNPAVPASPAVGPSVQQSPVAPVYPSAAVPVQQPVAAAVQPAVLAPIQQPPGLAPHPSSAQSVAPAVQPVPAGSHQAALPVSADQTAAAPVGSGISAPPVSLPLAPSGPVMPSVQEVGPPPVPAVPVLDIPTTAAASNPAVLRPEPRQLPNRVSTVEPIAKPMPEPQRTGEPTKESKGRPPHSHSRRRLVRLLVPLLFIVPMIIIVFGVLTILKNQSKEAAAPLPASVKRDVKILPDEPVPTPPVDPPKDEAVPVLPVPAPELPNIVNPPPELPSGIEPVDPQKAAEEALEKFLAAKSLNERLPLIETKTTEPELAKSSLASPLPGYRNLVPEFRETNAVEQVIDFYFTVEFDAGSNRYNPYTILVRKRGDSEPKVVADPFLDSYGGRLIAYAKSPSEKAGIFQVIISPLASCTDEKVPNREKKLTLKLLPRDNAKEITRAYFGRQSRIGRMLEDGTYSLSFGKARACTVMLRWNTEDRPDSPYLEALDLKTLDWNP